MEMSNWFHRGVELSMAQCNALDPVQKRHFGKGFKSYAELEALVDQLLSAVGCPIDPSLRVPTSIELGKEHNRYFCQLDDRRSIASDDFEACSLRGAASLALDKHASMFADRALSADLVDQFPDDAVSLFHEVSGNRWRIRIVMILPNMRSSMIHHMLIAR